MYWFLIKLENIITCNQSFKLEGPYNRKYHLVDGAGGGHIRAVYSILQK